MALRALTFTIEFPNESVPFPALAVVALPRVHAEVFAAAVLLPTLVNTAEGHQLILRGEKGEVR